MTAQSKPDVQIIAHNSPEYQDMVALRYRVLRKPLGLIYTPEQLAAEASDTLHAAFLNNVLVGSLILTRQSEDVVQMRQVAVDSASQGQGIGRALVAFAEQTARGQGGKTLVLHAREAVLPFYLKLGYEACGEPFEEVTLPHVEMRKTL